MAEQTITPQDVDDLDIAFPATVRHLMPPMDEIPDEFKGIGMGTKWNKFVSDWFFNGIKTRTLTVKEGIDDTQAMRHLRTIMGSFEPKHEHKEAAVAYLLSLWYKDVKWKANKPKS